MGLIQAPTSGGGLWPHDLKINSHRYLIKGVAFHSRSINPQLETVKYDGYARNVYEYWDEYDQKNNLFVIYWFLNNNDNLAYQESLKITEKKETSIQWGSFCEDVYKDNDDIPSHMSWSLLSFKYKTYEVLFGKVDKKNSGIDKASFLRFKDGIFPTDEEIYELYQLLSYIIGTELIPIGKSIYNNKKYRMQNYYNATYMLDVDRKISEREMPSLPIRNNDQYYLKIDSSQVFSDFLNKYFNNKEKYKLNVVLWYLNYSRTQHPFIKIQPLSSAFDILCSQFYEKGKKTIDENMFDKIKKWILQIIDEEITDDKMNEVFRGRISNLNNDSQNERNRNIFKDLSMELSELEIDALKSRNSNIHGINFNSDPVKIFKQANAYYVLVNRLLLKLLEFDKYIDSLVSKIFVIIIPAVAISQRWLFVLAKYR